MISIIIPNFNHAPYLKQRIDSVLNQTFTDFEVIILDDCSKDGSRIIIENYRNHPNVSHIIYNEKNSGSTFQQWQKGIDLAKGDYIWIAESDDSADNNLLRALVNNITKEDGIVLSYCQSHKMNSDGQITGSWKEQVRNMNGGDSFFSNDFVCLGTDFINLFLLEKNVIPNASAVLFRKDAYYKVGGVNLDVKACSDWLLWLKILMVGKIAFTQLQLNYFRYHENSVIATVCKQEQLFLSSNFDVIARKKFNQFINDRDNESLINKNCSFIEADYILDVFACYNKKAYAKMMKIFLVGLKESKNKKNLIVRLMKYLMK